MKTKTMISIGTLLVFTTGFLFFASTPVPSGCMVHYFLVVGLLGLIPVLIGPTRILRILGILAIYLSIHFAVSDFIVGNKEAERFNKQRDERATERRTR
jgi:hypothetical protein